MLLRYHIDVIHSLHYSFPLIRFGTKQVVTVHDMTSFIHPEAHLRLKVQYFRFFIRAAMSHADGIIFVSQSASKDCHALLGAPHGLAAVIHHGRSDKFRADPDADAVASVRPKYGLPSRTVLYIGTVEPRKNLSILVRSFANLVDAYPDVGLVIAGMKGWNNEFERLQQLIHDLRIEHRVTFPGFVDELDKPNVLAAAEIFVYPSLYEGFGLPVLEAMACGVPTITCNTSSLIEVAGDAAILVHPRDINAMTAALESLLSSPALRSEMREKAIGQAASFSWDKAAGESLKVYESVFSKGP
jgi:glycosyltransferase involved in cell wall biosynthesis